MADLVQNDFKKKILILGAGEMQLPIILRAKELGHFTLVADYDPLAPGLDFADLKLIISTNDTLALLEMALKHHLDGVLTTSDLPVRTVAHICNELGLKGPSLLAAKLCTNKYLLRNHLSENNFLVPKYNFIKSVDELKKIDYFPCVIKPIDSSGSRGVIKVCSHSDLAAAYNQSIQYSKEIAVIVEEFIDGYEYSIETLTQNNKTSIVAITEKIVKGENDLYFVEDRHVIPANLTDEKIELIKDVVSDVIKTINLGNSPTHTELKINDRGIYIIEIGARLGGDFITSDLVPLATGVDMLENAINIALNIKINTSITTEKFSGIQFITSENYNKVSDYINSDKHFIIKHQLNSYRKVKLQNSFDRLGYFIVQTDSREKLDQILNCQ